MKLIINKADWGLEAMGDLDTRLEAIAAAGFDGVECFFVDMEPARFCDRRAELGLLFNGGMFTPTIESFRRELARNLPYDPLLITCQGGHDYDSHEESLAFLTKCMKIAKEETDVEVVFETHRRCNLYSPWGTERLLEAIPSLRICADFSHFTVVSESDMTSSVAAHPDERGMIGHSPDPRKDRMMDIAISRADHIHARVGDLHSPQCLDPRIGEGLRWTELYEGWWDRIIARAKTEGRPYMTINPEYGPPPYAPADPVTKVPYADPWDLAVWTMNRFREKYPVN